MNLLKTAKKLFNDHESGIFTAMIIGSTITAVYTAVKCGPKCVQILDELNEEGASNVEKAKALAPVIAPTLISTSASIALTLVREKRFAAKLSGLASGIGTAVSTVKSLNEEKERNEKVTKEVVGEEKAAEIKRRMAEERVNGTVKEEIETIGPRDAKFYIFLEPFTGKLIRTDRTTIERAVNQCNQEIIRHSDYNGRYFDEEFNITFSDLFRAIGTSSGTGFGDMWGWNAVNDGLIELNLGNTFEYVAPDGTREPGYILDFCSPKPHLIYSDVLITGC